MSTEITDEIATDTQQLRKRFAMLLKEINAQGKEGQSMADFYDSLSHIRQESISRISSGKQALKDLMIMEVLKLNPDISLDWLFKGEGTMFKSHMHNYDARITTLESQFSELTSLLKESLERSNQGLD